MYKVKNITNGKLFINDLGVKLSSGEVIDLDAKFPRERSDASAHLRVAEQEEFVAILHKDVVHTQQAIDPHILAEMEKRIRQNIMNEVQTPTPAPTHDLTAILSKMDDLMDAVKKQPTGTPQIQPSYETENFSDADKLVEVHAKVLKRIAENTSGHVEAHESVSNSDMSKNADELDDLLK
jgi:hypothetical protein